MKRLLLLATLTLAPLAYAQTKWDLPTAYSPNSFQTQNVQQFAQDVDQATAGKLKVTVHPNASLYKATEIKRAVQTGQVQAGEFILSGAANENPLFGVDSVPFLATNYEDARRLYVAARPSLEKLLAAQGMKLLFSVPWPGQSLYSTKAIEAPDDFKGTKMRAYNPTTTRIAQLLKAQPVTIQLAELGQALATGTVENFLTSSASGIESKLYEQTKYFYPINGWLPRNATVVSLKAFDALDAAAQRALLQAALAAEERGWRLSAERDAEYVRSLGEHGMKVNSPSPALRSELQSIGDTMTAEWLKTAGAEGQAIIAAYRRR